MAIESVSFSPSLFQKTFDRILSESREPASRVTPSDPRPKFVPGQACIILDWEETPIVVVTRVNFFWAFFIFFLKPRVDELTQKNPISPLPSRVLSLPYYLSIFFPIYFFFPSGQAESLKGKKQFILPCPPAFPIEESRPI